VITSSGSESGSAASTTVEYCHWPAQYGPSVTFNSPSAGMPGLPRIAVSTWAFVGPAVHSGAGDGAGVVVRVGATVVGSP
jgi:hypothetical protein